MDSYDKKVSGLTHLSLVSLVWGIGKQNSPRYDAAERGVPSGAIQFDKISLKNGIEIQNHSDASKNQSGLTQMIMIGKSIRQIWVKLQDSHDALLLYSVIALNVPVYL